MNKIENALKYMKSGFGWSGDEHREVIEALQYAKTIEAKYEALKKDVDRYFEDRNRFKNTLVSAEELAEFWKLEEKLTKGDGRMKYYLKDHYYSSRNGWIWFSISNKNYRVSEDVYIDLELSRILTDYLEELNEKWQ